MKKIIVTGTVAYDFIFNFDNYFSNYILPDKIHQINISLLTEHYEKTYGGTAGNQGYYLNKLGIPASIYSTVGKDFDEYKKFLLQNQISANLIKVYSKKRTAAGFAITDKRDNQIWMYSKGAMKYATELHLKSIIKDNKNYLVIIAPNEPKAVDNFVDECVKNKINFVLDLGFNIPITSKITLQKGIKHASIIFGNDYEIDLMEKKIGAPMKKKLRPNQILVTTLADKGSEIFYNKKTVRIGIFKTKAVDPTGAGDAYRAGFIYGYLNNQPIEACGWMGAVAASFAVEVKGTMNLKFNKSLFEKRLSFE